MSRNRHSDENRVARDTSASIRLIVDMLRRRATRRKLVLLECGIIRHAPFAECGRSLWDLIVELPWFEEYYVGEAPDYRSSCLKMNGHDAINWFEQHADGTVGEEYFHAAEYYFGKAAYSAEAYRFETPDDRRDELEICYGAADWLNSLRRVGPNLWNVLDYYLVNFSGKFYSYAGLRPFHPDHRAIAVNLIFDILGHRLKTPRFDPSWRTADTVNIASAMYESRDFSLAPILADALEEAGCDNADVIAHCRGSGPHVRGCWVVDLLLGKE